MAAAPLGPPRACGRRASPRSVAPSAPRIVPGDLEDGDLLPKQEAAAGRVRVQQAVGARGTAHPGDEGLVGVRRGNSVGRFCTAAGVTTSSSWCSLAGGLPRWTTWPAPLRHFENHRALPARRGPTARTWVLPRLRDIHDQTRAAIDDLRPTPTWPGGFHEESWPAAATTDHPHHRRAGAIWSAHARCGPTRSPHDEVSDAEFPVPAAVLPPPRLDGPELIRGSIDGATPTGARPRGPPAPGVDPQTTPWHPRQQVCRRCWWFGRGGGGHRVVPGEPAQAGRPT